MTGESDVVCSFCGVGNDEARLIAGPDVFICEECVELCVEVIRGGEDEKVSTKDNPCKIDSDALSPLIGKWMLESTTVEESNDLVGNKIIEFTEHGRMISITQGRSGPQADYFACRVVDDSLLETKLDPRKEIKHKFEITEQGKLRVHCDDDEAVYVRKK